MIQGFEVIECVRVLVLSEGPPQPSGDAEEANVITAHIAVIWSREDDATDSAPGTSQSVVQHSLIKQDT